jgi:cell division protein FtsL
MIRVNALLFAMLLLCALAVVTSQHEARRLFVALQDEQDRGRELEIEFGQLQLEQSTWAMQSRVEQVASKQLGMRVPDVGRVRVVPPPPASSNP